MYAQCGFISDFSKWPCLVTDPRNTCRVTAILYSDAWILELMPLGGEVLRALETPGLRWSCRAKTSISVMHELRKPHAHSKHVVSRLKVTIHVPVSLPTSQLACTVRSAQEEKAFLGALTFKTARSPYGSWSIARFPFNGGSKPHKTVGPCAPPPSPSH